MIQTTFLTTSQLARLGDSSAETVRYQMKLGRLVPDAKTERGSLFSRETAERWAAERKAAKTARSGAAA